MKISLARCAFALLLGVPVLAQLPTPASPFTAPVAIPVPPLGVSEVAGAFTHYVDVSNPAATDDSNPEGSPARPRRTVPTELRAGAVVEVRGGPYSIGTVVWTSLGGRDTPVFIKGVGQPTFTGTAGSNIVAAGSNLIIEGMVFDNVAVWMAPTLSRFALRGSIVRNHSPGRSSSAVAVSGSDIVIVGNEVHHNGDPNAATQIDITGVFAQQGASRVWILDNHIHHNGGDAVLVGAATSPEPWVNSVYIARNTLHEDRENGVDIKRARDVIVSQNIIYGYVPRSSSAGEAIVTHNMPERVWILNNLLSTATFGAVCTGAAGYAVIGNVIYNMHHPAGTTYDPANVFASAGILTYNTTSSAHVNNTIWNADSGISYGGRDKTDIVNNVIASVSAHHIGFDLAAGYEASATNHNLLDATPRVRVADRVMDCSAFPDCLRGDPLFESTGTTPDLRIKRGSPAIDAGVVHPAYAAFKTVYGLGLDKDVLGHPRVSGVAPDLGAAEFESGAPPAPKNPRIIR